MVVWVTLYCVSDIEESNGPKLQRPKDEVQETKRVEKKLRDELEGQLDT